MDQTLETQHTQHGMTENTEFVDRPASPGKPYLSESDVTPDVLTIRWDKPLKDGGSPITGYLVEHRRTGSPHWVRATPLLITFPELTLSGLEPGWRYQFRVFAENAVGMSDASDFSEPLTVTLQRSAITSPRFLEQLQDATALENEKVEFVAHFVGQPPPKICWFKDNFEIFSSRRTRILTESDRSVLTIHQSALADEGEIKCTATNRAGHASTKAKLTLEAPPSIRLPRQYEDGLLFEIGEIMRFKVSVAGRPNPLVFWSHNGETIQNNDRYEIENADKASTLRVGDARRSDRGDYQIKAVNTLGEDIVSFLVTVTDKPSPPGKAKVVMALGRSVTLAWNTSDDDGGCKIGNYIVEYYRIGWNVWLKAATTRQLTTILGDLIEGSEYKFRVKAESPYGVSEPSEESELIFIPDPKRGMMAPPPRSRSQQREIDNLLPPVAAKRKKTRSQSSSRAENSPNNIPIGLLDGEMPLRPQRTKTKSNPTTPEASPRLSRKEPIIDTNKQIYDRSSIARELAYGSPEIKIKKSENLPSPTLPIRKGSLDNNKMQQFVNRKEKSPSPQPRSASSQISSTISKSSISNKNASPQKCPSPKDRRSPSPISFNKSPSPTSNTVKKVPRDRNHETYGSSEFMLVLMPNGNKNHGSQSELQFDFDGIPPPLSLSAPELGAEPPSFEHLIRSASSTELLHERAMIRFFEEAAAEEQELQKLKGNVSDKDEGKQIPKIQVNSKDNADLVGLERKHSIRRRLSAGGTVPQQILWAQKRHSLRNSNELNELIDSKLSKHSLTNKRNLLMRRQRSDSEEKDNEQFQIDRTKLSKDQKKPAAQKNSIDIVEEETWNIGSTEDYEESISEEETSSEDERFKKESATSRLLMDEEETTYHPRMGNMFSRQLKTKTDEPFEILTKPNPLPDPNFIPKPILKKRDQPGFSDDKMPRDLLPDEHIRLDPGYVARDRSPSLNSEKLWTTNNALHRLEVSPIKSANVTDRPVSPRQRSLSLAPGLQKSAPMPAVNLPQRRGSLTSAIDELTSSIGNPTPINRIENPNPSSGILGGISAIAGITGLAAATIVIPRQLMDRQKHEEETKVIVDHYADIVARHSLKKQYYPQPSTSSYRSYTDNAQQEPIVMASLPDRVYDAYSTSNKSAQKVTSEEILAPPPPLPVRRSPSRSSKSSEVSSLSEISDSPSVSIKSNFGNTQSSPSNSLSRKDASLGLQSMTRAAAIGSTKDSSTSLDRERKESSEKETRNKTKIREPRDSSISRSTSQSPTKPKHKRKSSPSPLRTIATQVDKEFISSPSPKLLSVRHPKMKEIMTQTSTEIRVPVPLTQKQEELKAIAEVKVKSLVDYLTDLAMFSVACWFYFFSNELYAIPVMIVMVYRQLHAAIKNKIPKWMMPKRKER